MGLWNTKMMTTTTEDYVEVLWQYANALTDELEGFRGTVREFTSESIPVVNMYIIQMVCEETGYVTNLIEVIIHKKGIMKVDGKETYSIENFRSVVSEIAHSKEMGRKINYSVFTQNIHKGK